MQITVPALPKDCIRGIHGIPEATTLLSRVFHNSSLGSCDAMGQIAKWAIEPLPFDITYKPRRAIKSQVLADFVAEWTEAELPKEYDTYSN